MSLLDECEVVDDFASYGIHAFTTTRALGSLSTLSDEPVGEVMARWDAVRGYAKSKGVPRFGTAAQVHGARIIVHEPGWDGWLRSHEADGHVSMTPGTAMAVTIADCVPVFIAHPSGACAILHSGWRGTAARIVEHGIAALAHRGLPSSELRIHLGPAICGKCYEVSPNVIQALTGRTTSAPEPVDLRALIASHARAAGVDHVTISTSCTRHHNERLFSHRAGDRGRQVAVIFATRAAQRS